MEAVFTGAQIAEFLAPMPIGTPFPSPEHRAVAVDVVRYVGEPVAVVVAIDRYVARDAADAILVQYEMLPAVVDPELGMTGQPALIHPDFPNNIALGPIPGGTGAARGGAVDDSAIDKAFAEADVVISQRMLNQRLAPTAMEPRGVVVELRAGKRHDDDLVVDANPAHVALAHRGDERAGPGPGAGHRAGGRRRLRREGQRLR